MNMFKQASRKKLRFTSPRGELSVEQLWDLPLQSTTKANLNDIAIEISSSIKTVENFITGQSKDNSIGELKLSILKEIIADRLQENKDNMEKQKTLKEIAKLEGIQEAKADKALEKLSNKELNRKLKELKNRSL